MLLEGVESCCDNVELNSFRKDRKDGERVFEFEMHCNKVGRFLRCFVSLVNEKRFTLIFLVGKGFPKGWRVLATKLRSIRVLSLDKTMQEA